MAIKVHFRLRLIKDSSPHRFEWMFDNDKKEYLKSDVDQWIVALRADNDKVKLGHGTLTADKGSRLRLAEYLETVIDC